MYELLDSKTNMHRVRPYGLQILHYKYLFLVDFVPSVSFWNCVL